MSEHGVETGRKPFVPTGSKIRLSELCSLVLDFPSINKTQLARCTSLSLQGKSCFQKKVQSSPVTAKSKHLGVVSLATPFHTIQSLLGNPLKTAGQQVWLNLRDI